MNVFMETVHRLESGYDILIYFTSLRKNLFFLKKSQGIKETKENCLRGAL